MKSSNQYDWNVTRKFSWGHIVAFVALIFMSYVMYMGAFYSNGGNFIKAAMVVAVIDVLILGVFIGAQLLKGTDGKFDQCIIFERILICLCPVVFILAMIPYNHFWGVYSQRDEIETQFNKAIEQSGAMFDEYNQYVNERLENYSKQLSRLRSAGVITSQQQQNYYLTLQLQLRNKDQQLMEEKALGWIDKANTGASVWNAFLIGNLNQIRTAVKGWEETLDQYSRPVLSNESPEAVNNLIPKPKTKKDSRFDYNQPWRKDKKSKKVNHENESPSGFPSSAGRPHNPALYSNNIGTMSENEYDKEEQQTVLSFSEVRSEKGLREDLFDELQKKYSKGNGLNLNTIWSGLILAFMLLLPYLLQKRNTRAHGYYHLWPWTGTTPKPHHEGNPNVYPPYPNPNTPPHQRNPYPPHHGNDSDIYTGTM